MAGFLKAILISIIAASSMVVFMNAAYFFPWYMVIVETTSAVSQMIATDNYLTHDNFILIDEQLRNRPIFRLRSAEDKLWIKAEHIDEGRTAIEGYPSQTLDFYYGQPDHMKPYVQMGNFVEVTIHANYPFQMEIRGNPIVVADIPVTFTITTTTLKHYKDLPYVYPDGGGTYELYDR